MKMKKLLAAALSALMLVSLLAACGGGSDSPGKSNPSPASVKWCCFIDRMPCSKAQSTVNSNVKYASLWYQYSGFRPGSQYEQKPKT